MPRPYPTPEGWAIDALLEPIAGASLTTVEDKAVSVKIFMTENRGERFRIRSFQEEFVDVETVRGLRPFRLPWASRAQWRVATPAPEEVARPSWVRVGVQIRFHRAGPAVLNSMGPVRLVGPAIDSFRIAAVHADHIEVEQVSPLANGRYRVNLDNFGSLWQANEVHRVPNEVPAYFRVGSRVRPAGRNGEPLGEISYLITQVRNLGEASDFFSAVPLWMDGSRGFEQTFPLWNVTTAWAQAPDDPGLLVLTPGMKVYLQGGEEATIVDVNQTHGQVTVRHETTRRLSVTEVEVPTQGKPKKSRSRFSRTLRRA